MLEQDLICKPQLPYFKNHHDENMDILFCQMTHMDLCVCVCEVSGMCVRVCVCE